MSKKILFVIVAVVLFSGCRERSSEILTFSSSASNLIVVSDDSQARLSEIAEEIIAVKLETTENSLINEIRSVRILNNHCFILHGTRHEVLMFDLNGIFVRQIGRIGRGPGEYTDVINIAVDMDDERLLLGTRQGVLVYDSDGLFIQNVNLGASFNFMIVHNKQLYSFFTASNVPMNREVNEYYKFLATYQISYDATEWNLVDSVHFRNYRFQPGFISLSSDADCLSQSNQSIYLYVNPVQTGDRDKHGGIDTLYIYENQQLIPCFITQFTGNGQQNPVVSKMLMTDNYLIITHSVSPPGAGSPPYPKSILSQYYIDLRTMEGKNAANGFIDDFYGGDKVIITPIPGTNKFYYYRENDYSPEMKTVPNPTLYIGTFKE